MTTQTSKDRKRDYVTPILLKHATLKDITLLTGSGFSHHGVDK